MEHRAASPQTFRVVPALTAARVRGDLDVLSRGGLPLEDFLAEATASVATAVPWVAACVGTHDPATLLLTSARKYGDLHDAHDQDALVRPDRVRLGGADVLPAPGARRRRRRRA